MDRRLRRWPLKIGKTVFFRLKKRVCFKLGFLSFRRQKPSNLTTEPGPLSSNKLVIWWIEPAGWFQLWRICCYISFDGAWNTRELVTYRRKKELLDELSPQTHKIFGANSPVCEFGLCVSSQMLIRISCTYGSHKNKTEIHVASVILISSVFAASNTLLAVRRPRQIRSNKPRSCAVRLWRL